MSYNCYGQIQPQRGILGNFSSGEILFHLNEGFIPSRSYFRIKAKISKGDDTVLTKEFGIGPNLKCCDNLFQQIDVRINDVCVSRINDYVAQCAALKTRISKSINKRESMYGDLDYSQGSVNDRILSVADNGKKLPNSDQVCSLTRAQTQLGANINEAADTVAIAANDTLITYTDAAGGDLDLQLIHKVGEGILIRVDETTELYEITEVVDALNIRVDRPPSFVGVAAAGGANHARFNIRKVPQYTDFVTNQANDLDLIWRPSVGFFDINQPVYGKICVKFQPHVNGVYQKYFVEGLSNRTPLLPGEAADAEKFKVEITEFNLYIWKTDPRYSGVLTYSYTDMMCSSQNITSNSLTQRNFEMKPNCFMVSVCLQDSEAGENITLSRSKFKIVNDEELKLTRFYLTKDGLTLPDPINTLSISRTGNVNNALTQYYESLSYSGHYILTKTETFRDWINTGMHLTFRWPLGPSNNMQIYTQFSDAFTRNPQLLFIQHCQRSLKIDVSGGMVQSVSASGS